MDVCPDCGASPETCATHKVTCPTRLAFANTVSKHGVIYAAHPGFPPIRINIRNGELQAEWVEPPTVRAVRKMSEGIKIPDLPAVKFDSDKEAFDLIPPNALFAVARIFSYGAKKYAPRNWEKGMDYGRLFGAACRHLWAWWSGEDADEESGMPHLAHAAVCVLMMLEYTLTATGKDDRPRKMTWIK